MCVCLFQPFVMNLACVTMGMTMNETLAAATLNSAASLNMSATHGSIEVGKVADAVIVDSPRCLYTLYTMYYCVLYVYIYSVYCVLLCTVCIYIYILCILCITVYYTCIYILCIPCITVYYTCIYILCIPCITVYYMCIYIYILCIPCITMYYMCIYTLYTVYYCVLYVYIYILCIPCITVYCITILYVQCRWQHLVYQMGSTQPTIKHVIKSGQFVYSRE